MPTPKKQKKEETATRGILSFFKPSVPPQSPPVATPKRVTPTPRPSTKKRPSAQRATPKQIAPAHKVDKGKRKADAIDLITPDSSDVEIVEPPPRKRPAGRTMATAQEGANDIAGPSESEVTAGGRNGLDSIGGAEVQPHFEAELDIGSLDAQRAAAKGEESTPDVPPEDMATAAGMGEAAGDESQWGDDEVEGMDEPEHALEEVEWDEDRSEFARDADAGQDDGWGEESMDTGLADASFADDVDETSVPVMDAQEDGAEGSGVVQGSSKDLSKDLDSGASCPVCSQNLVSLPGKERELHVNKCLDGPSVASTSFFPRLSSLFRRNVTSTPVPAQKHPVSSSKLPVSASKSLPNPSKPTCAPLPATSLRPLSKLPTFLNPTAVAGPNAFTAIMTTHTETKLWKEAEASDKLKGRMPTGTKKAVPFYKWIDGMEVTVDAFKYGKIDGCKGYFLSHAHSDHYQNMNSSWAHGPIYCSLTTANLIKLKLNVKDQWLHVLPMNQTVDVQGIKVTLIDANHCPGSVLFLFEGPHTDPKSPYTKTPSRIFRHLHCGDFRASPAHITHPAMAGKRIDICYLDTTYLSHQYCFPAQELVINACAGLVRARVADGDEGALHRTGGDQQGMQEALMKGWLAKAADEVDVVDPKEDDDGKGAKGKEKDKVEKLLVLVGTYSIGKERIVKGIAKALNTKIYCDDHKLALLKAQDDPDLHSLITRDPLEGAVHIVYLSDIKRESLQTYLAQFRNTPGGYTKVIGLRPTGWTYRPEAKVVSMPTIPQVLERERLRKFSPAGLYPQRDSTSTCMAFGVPYSEHSSFYELTCFALSLECPRFIPTVNVHSEASRNKMNTYFRMWAQEKKKRADARIPRMVPPRSLTHW